MMIGFVVEDSHRAIELFGKDEANHLVGEGHFAQRNLLRRRLIDRVAETVGPADKKDQPLGHIVHLLLHIRSKLERSELLPMLVEQHEAIARLQRLEDKNSPSFSFCCASERFFTFLMSGMTNISNGI